MSSLAVSGPSVSISVDLELEERGVETRPREALESSVHELIDLLGDAQLSATWFASEPAISSSLHHALRSDSAHKAAISMDGDWRGHENGRNRFAAEFLRRKKAADLAGIEVRTLAAPHGVAQENFDLLVRQGISVIRSDSASATRHKDRARLRGVVSLRYGLWQISDVESMSRGGWFGGYFAAKQICRTIDGTIGDRSVIHFAIDAVRLSVEGRTGLRAVSKVLAHIVGRRRDGLQAGSIVDIVSRLAAPRKTRPAQSVLRAA